MFFLFIYKLVPLYAPPVHSWNWYLLIAFSYIDIGCEASPASHPPPLKSKFFSFKHGERLTSVFGLTKFRFSKIEPEFCYLLIIFYNSIHQICNPFWWPSILLIKKLISKRIYLFHLKILVVNSLQKPL